MGRYERGSEWRRWDLHIHTPGTNKNDQFTGKDIEEKWDNFYSDIDKYIGEGEDANKSIAAIGITDYLSIDNYIRVIEEKRLHKSIKLVLPNVEMRILPIATKAPINIHFIFNPNIVDELEERFFSRLCKSVQGTQYYATKTSLERLGKSLCEESKNPYLDGVEQFVLEFQAIKEVFDKDDDLRRNTIIGVSNSTGDGVTGVVSHSDYLIDQGGISQLVATRYDIYKYVDIIYSGKPSDVEYFLGKKSDNEDTVISKCGSLMPCVLGCDAHDNSKIFNPTDQKYCWIKADPTFEGLKQIIFEPAARVRIQALKPEEKQSYYIIKNIKFNDPEFQTEPITFNDKLTCIIGGKSTGKSLLLHNLASVIDSDQVLKKAEVTKNTGKTISNIEVQWSDGQTSTILNGSSDKRKIVYIPQTYLNRLSDQNEEKTEIDNLIEEIVLLDSNAKEAYDKREKKISDIKPDLDKNIYDTISLFDTVQGYDRQIKELGTDKSINQEIRKLQREKDKLVKESNVSEKDISNYQKSLMKVGEFNKKISELEKDIKLIKGIQLLSEPVKIPFGLTEDSNKMVEKEAILIDKVLQKEWASSRENIISHLNTEISACVVACEKEKEYIEDSKEKISNNQAIEELSKRIQNEKEKLAEYESLKKSQTAADEKFSKKLNKIVTSSGDYFKIHREYADFINQEDKMITDDLEFSVSVPFRRDMFCEAIKRMVDRRGIKSVINLDEFDSKDYTNEMLKKLVLSVFNEKISLKSGYDIEEFLRNILGDWYNISYTVKMDNDLIHEMSPGKKALVLLKLLISLAESKCPILIDQPEDDLDNRSIFVDLIPFIREKKVSRQIIIVTHNANIVLGGDAEEVIVANQKGKNAPNIKYRFEYRSGSIEDNSAIFDTDGKVMDGVLNKQGVQQHICEILEGGEKAFELRKTKYFN